MTRRTRLLAVLALLSLGIALRLVHWSTWPRGPWADETYAIRAARLLLTGGRFRLFETTPLVPVEAGYVNAYVSNVYLVFAAAVDRAAGGGIASIRALSIGPSIALFLATMLLMAVVSDRRRGPFLTGSFLACTSMWLLATGRWGWDAVATSALVALSAALGLRGFHARSHAQAMLAGALLGLAQYGYVAGRLALVVPVAIACWGALTANRRIATGAGLVLLSASLVAGPLFVHLARNPDRATARVREISILSGRSAADSIQALAGNVRDYAALFFVRGDSNERHGDPSRPVVPTVVAGLFLVGAARGLREARVESVLLLSTACFLAGGLFSTDGANAYRVSLAAPFGLALAALGGAWLVERTRTRFAAAILAAAVLVAGVTDVQAFVRWAESPRTWGAFGGPERELADAVALEESKGGPAELLLNPLGGARNPFVVETLLGGPKDGGRRSVRLGSLLSSWRFLPARDILYADADAEEVRAAARAVSGSEVSVGKGPSGRTYWVLFRIPRAEAVLAAQRDLDRVPRLPALPRGNLRVPEDGLVRFAWHHQGSVTLNDRSLFDPALRPGGFVTAHLEAGWYRVSVSPASLAGDLRMVGPDGFALQLREPQ